ncbi:hypothetical protein LZ30DRAFT_186167, partial [Colletotrichum cereale]
MAVSEAAILSVILFRFLVAVCPLTGALSAVAEARSQIACRAQSLAQTSPSCRSSHLRISPSQYSLYATATLG